MKSFFAVLGVIFLILIVIGGVGFGLIAIRENPLDAIGFWFISMRGNMLDKGAKAYADTAIPAIVTTWSEKELLDRESPEFKKSVTQQQLDQTFQRFSALGHLQKCEPAKGQPILSGNQVKGEYTAKAEFDKGEALVQLEMIKHGRQWQILGFLVRSPVLQQQQEPQQQQPQPQQH